MIDLKLKLEDLKVSDTLGEVGRGDERFQSVRGEFGGVSLRSWCVINFKMETSQYQYGSGTCDGCVFHTLNS